MLHKSIQYGHAFGSDLEESLSPITFRNRPTESSHRVSCIRVIQKQKDTTNMKTVFENFGLLQSQISCIWVTAKCYWHIALKAYFLHWSNCFTKRAASNKLPTEFYSFERSGHNQFFSTTCINWPHTELSVNCFSFCHPNSQAVSQTKLLTKNYVGLEILFYVFVIIWSSSENFDSKFALIFENIKILKNIIQTQYFALKCCFRKQISQ